MVFRRVDFEVLELAVVGRCRGFRMNSTTLLNPIPLKHPETL